MKFPSKEVRHKMGDYVLFGTELTQKLSFLFPFLTHSLVQSHPITPL